MFFVCLLFYVGVNAQGKKPLNVICDRGDTTKGRPPLSAVGLDSSDPAHFGEQVWLTMFKGKRVFNFTWKQMDGSKPDLAKNLGLRSVNIKLDNDSLVVLYSSSRPRIIKNDYWWFQADVSNDEIKQFTSHKMVFITFVAGNNVQYPLFSFNGAEQSGIETASRCFFYNTQK